MRECKHCGRKNYAVKRGRSDVGFCHDRRQCQLHQTEWIARNWDQLPEDNHSRIRAEDKFWEVTPEQRKQYSYFYSLIRSPRTVKTRKCMICKDILTSNKTTSPESRTCFHCQKSLSKFGALASHT